MHLAGGVDHPTTKPVQNAVYTKIIFFFISKYFGEPGLTEIAVQENFTSFNMTSGGILGEAKNFLGTLLLAIFYTPLYIMT